jgi:hypothetical protein
MKQDAFQPDFRAAKENRLIRAVFNTDLRNSHDGLYKIAKDLKVNIDNLSVGEFIVFVNKKRSALKLYAAGNTIAHFRMPGDRVMNMKVLAVIPKFFNGKELKYTDALAEVIRKEFKK